jgi:hypothetical protein
MRRGSSVRVDSSDESRLGEVFARYALAEYESRFEKEYGFLRPLSSTSGYASGILVPK